MFKTGVLIITALMLGLFYWIGLSINHLVIISIFAFSILFGALIIADDSEEKRDSMYNDFGKNTVNDKNSEKSF